MKKNLKNVQSGYLQIMERDLNIYLNQVNIYCFQLPKEFMFYFFAYKLTKRKK